MSGTASVILARLRHAPGSYAQGVGVAGGAVAVHADDSSTAAAGAAAAGGAGMPLPTPAPAPRRRPAARAGSDDAPTLLRVLNADGQGWHLVSDEKNARRRLNKTIAMWQARKVAATCVEDAALADAALAELLQECEARAAARSGSTALRGEEPLGGASESPR